MSFVTEADKLLSEALQPFGFKKLKNTHIFARLINNEILYYLYFDKTGLKNKNIKYFKIKSGIKTIYSLDISTSALKESSLDLPHYTGVVKKVFPPKAQWGLLAYNEDENEYDFESALQLIKEIFIPAFSTVTDISSYIEFAKLTLYFKLFGIIC